MSFPQTAIRYITNLWRGDRSPRPMGNEIFTPIGMAVNPFGVTDVLQDFLEIPEVNAPINMKARMFATGRVLVVNKNGKPQENDPVAVMLRSPNWLQDGPEFMRQTKLNRYIFGNEYIYKLKPVGLPVSRLFTLPPNMMRVEYDSTQLFFLQFDQPTGAVKYFYRQNGVEYPIDAEKIIHMNDNRVSFGDMGEDLIKGVSTLESLQPCRSNLRYTYESLGVILRNRGALGILSSDGKDGIGAQIPLDEKEIEKVHQKYEANYGGLAHQRQLIITSMPLKWQQMGVNPDKLGLFQGKEEDFSKILDGYGLPMELFVRPKGATYENQKQARKGAYQDTIMPDAQEWAATMNAELMEGKTDNRIVIDYSHLPVFQEDLKARGDSIVSISSGLSRMLQDRAITVEEYKEEIQRFGIKIHSLGAPDPSEEAGQMENAQAVAQSVQSLQAAVNSGDMTREAAISVMTIIFGLTTEEAQQVITEPIKQEDSEQTQEGDPAPGGGGDQPGNG